jgi:hypothetical protein
MLVSCGADSQNDQNRQPLRLTARFDTGFVDEPYNTTLTADGGIRPYRFNLEGSLPRGLSFSNGRISGTPQERGTFELIISVEDANLSSRTQKVTLNIGDTPPPRLDQVFPLAEVSDPFPYLFRVRDREARGFQAQIRLRDLKTALDSFKADSNVLYVIRYNEESGLLDIDAAFTRPRRDLEVFRFTATPLPDKRVRPDASFRETRVAFYDRNGRLAGNAQAIERTASEGRFRFSDLEAIARNWGRRLTPGTPNTTTPATPQAPAATAPQSPANNPTTPPQGQPGDQGRPTAPTTENQAASPPGTAQGTPTEQPTSPNPAQPLQPGQAQPLQPGQAQPPQPGQAQSSQAEQTQPTPPAGTPAAQPQGQPAPAPEAQKLEGDLNSDGVVDQKDLDLLRSSYAWASVSAGQAPPPTNPPRTPTPPPPPPGSGTSGAGSGESSPGDQENPDNSEGK